MLAFLSWFLFVCLLVFASCDNLLQVGWLSVGNHGQPLRASESAVLYGLWLADKAFKWLVL